MFEYSCDYTSHGLKVNVIHEKFGKSTMKLLNSEGKHLTVQDFFEAKEATTEHHDLLKEILYMKLFYGL